MSNGQTWLAAMCLSLCISSDSYSETPDPNLGLIFLRKWGKMVAGKNSFVNLRRDPPEGETRDIRFSSSRQIYSQHQNTANGSEMAERFRKQCPTDASGQNTCRRTSGRFERTNRRGRRTHPASVNPHRDGWCFCAILFCSAAERDALRMVPFLSGSRIRKANEDVLSAAPSSVYILPKSSTTSCFWFPGRRWCASYTSMCDRVKVRWNMNEISRWLYIHVRVEFRGHPSEKIFWDTLFCRNRPSVDWLNHTIIAGLYLWDSAAKSSIHLAVYTQRMKDAAYIDLIVFVMSSLVCIAWHLVRETSARVVFG